MRYAIIKGKMGLFITFSVLELQRGYLYQNGVKFRQKVIGAVLGSSSLLLRGSKDFSLAVGHVNVTPYDLKRSGVVVETALDG